MPLRAPNAADARAMLVIVTVAVTLGTLYPLRLVDSPAELLDGLATIAREPFDAMTLTHLLPAGLLAWLAVAGGASPKAAGLVIAAGLALLELAQAAVEPRHARGGDILAQWAGVGLGLWLAGRRWPTPRLPMRTLWGLLGLGLTLAAATQAFSTQQGLRLGPNDPSFRLLIGDEFRGGRPWLGAVRSAAVYAAPCDDTTAALLHATPLPSPQGLRQRLTLGPSVIYDFTSTPQIREDASAAVADLGSLGVILHVAPPGLTGQLEAAQAGPAHSIVRAQALSEALQTAGWATIEIDATPANIEQLGPARLLTLSKGQHIRNLTLGQVRDAVDLRVRTRHTGKNAARLTTRFPGVLRANTPVHLLACTNGGSVWLWVDGRPAGQRHYFTGPGDWLGLHPRWRDWPASLVIALPIAVAAGRWASTPRRGLVAALAPVVLILLAGWSAALLWDRPVHGFIAVPMFLSAAAGLALARLLPGQARPPTPTQENPCPPPSPTAH
jgi:hypothetical protein